GCTAGAEPHARRQPRELVVRAVPHGVRDGSLAGWPPAEPRDAVAGAREGAAARAGSDLVVSPDDTGRRIASHRVGSGNGRLLRLDTRREIRRTQRDAAAS